MLCYVTNTSYNFIIQEFLANLSRKWQAPPVLNKALLFPTRTMLNKRHSHLVRWSFNNQPIISYVCLPVIGQSEKPAYNFLCMCAVIVQSEAFQRLSSVGATCMDAVSWYSLHCTATLWNLLFLGEKRPPLKRCCTDLHEDSSLQSCRLQHFLWKG